MNIMQLVEGKKYKDQWEREWYVDKNGIFDECSEDFTNFYNSKHIRRAVFTEVKEPITITLEAEELELLKKIIDGEHIASYEYRIEMRKKLRGKLK